MADTLEDLRRHIDELIGRLADEEATEQRGPLPVVGGQSEDASGLESQIDSLGGKIEGASDVLAELADLLESQTERIETIENQLGDPDVVDRQEAAPAAAETVEPAASRAVAPTCTVGDALAAMQAAFEQGLARLERGVTRLEQGLSGLEARLGNVDEAIAELRDRGHQRDRETRELEERLIVIAEQLAERPAEPPPSVAAAPAEQMAAPLAAAPATQAVVAAQSDEILDSAAAKRLEELVEREVSLQHDFRPGASEPGEPRERRTRPTVMVVDDSADARTLLSIYLSKTGYQVVTAASAEDCLAKLRYHCVDAIILDASMPGGGGGHVCEVLRSETSHGSRGPVPVIVYTAYPDEFPRAVAERWQADDYVVKGGDMLPLITALVRHTERGTSRGASPQSSQGSAAAP